MDKQKPGNYRRVVRQFWLQSDTGNHAAAYNITYSTVKYYDTLFLLQLPTATYYY